MNAGPTSDSCPGPTDASPYVPSWCYPKGPRICPCGHHEGFHADSGACSQAQICSCSGLPADCFTPDEEMFG